MAGNTEIIDEIIDVPAVTQQHDVLSKQLDGLDQQFIQLTKDVLAFTKAAGDAKSFSDFNKNAGASAIAQQKLIDIQQKAVIITIKQQQEQQRLSDLENKASISKNRLEQSNARVAASQDKASAAAQKAQSPYQQLSKQLDEMRLKAKDVAVQFGVNSKQFQDAQKPVQELDKRLKTIDSTLGQNQRNVGNYSESVRGALDQFYEGINRSIPGMGTFTRTVVEGFGKITDSIRRSKNDISSFTQGGFGFKPVEIDGPTQISTEGTVANTVAVEQNTAANEANAASEVEKGVATKESVAATAESSIATKESSGFLSILGEGFLGFSTVAFVAAIGAATYYLSQFKSTGETVSTWLAGAKNVFATWGEELINSLQGKGKGQTDVAEAFKKGVDIEQIKQQLAHATELDDAQNQQLQAQSDYYRALSKDRNTDIASRKKYVKDAQDLEKQILDNQKENAEQTLQVAVLSSNKLKKLTPEQFEGLLNKDSQGNIQGDLKFAQGLATNGQQFTGDAYELYKAGIEKIITYKQGATNRIVKLQADADNMELRADNALAKAEDRLNKARIQGALDAANEILDSDKAGYADKIAANEKFLNSSLALIEAKKKAELDAAGLGGSRSGRDSRTEAVTRAAIEQETSNEVIKVRTQAANNIKKIQKALNDELDKDQKAAVDREIGRQREVLDALLNSENEKLIALDKGYADQVSAITRQYADGAISEEDYQKQLLTLKQNYGAERIRVEIEVQKKILEAQLVAAAYGNGDVKGIRASIDKLSKLQIEATNLATNTELENIKKVEEARKRLSQVEQEIAQTSIDLIKTVVDGGYQQQLQALEKQKQQIDENANSEKVAVDRSLLSSRQKALQNKIIDAEAQQDKKRIAIQEAQIKRKQAEFDRAVSIGNVIEQTAVAVASALKYPPPFGEILAVSLGVLGALQLAKIVATPLPQYAKGTGFHPGGDAIIGEQGSELVKYPSGHTFLSPDTATKMALPRGTSVTPAWETSQMMLQLSAYYRTDLTKTEDLLRENNRLQRRIAERPQSSNRGLAEQIVLAQQITERRNSYFK